MEQGICLAEDVLEVTLASFHELSRAFRKLPIVEAVMADPYIDACH